VGPDHGRILAAILAASGETATTSGWFYDVFDVASEANDNLPDALTLLLAVKLGGQDGATLARHGTGALFNAGAGFGYPPTVIQVLDQVKAAWDSGQYKPLARQVDGYNNLGCLIR
jgi:hypothetical protein